MWTRHYMIPWNYLSGGLMALWLHKKSSLLLEMYTEMGREVMCRITEDSTHHSLHNDGEGRDMMCRILKNNSSQNKEKQEVVQVWQHCGDF